MFVRRSMLNDYLKPHDIEIKQLNERYWKLYQKHERLLSHLGLVEVEVQARAELRSKTDKEAT